MTADTVVRRAWTVKRLYLLAYNAGMLAGWIAVGVAMLRHFAEGNGGSTLLPRVRKGVRALLMLSCVEIVHAAVGLVRSSPTTTAVQCLVRLASFVAAIDCGSATTAKSPAAAATLAAWAVGEWIRYGFFTAGLAATDGNAPRWLVWLRYSGFLVLYPIGMAGEFSSFLNAVPYLRETQMGSVQLPNSSNFAFNAAWWMQYGLLPLYPFGAVTMYRHMLAQRRKILGSLQ